MVPGILNEHAPRSIFPDGIRTSGQHPPLYDALKPYEEFPKEISGPTVWRKEDYVNKPEQWIHHFTASEIQELSDAADQFIERGTPLTGISKVNLPILPLHPRADLISAKGKLPSPIPLQSPHQPPRRPPKWQRLHPF